MISLIFKSEKYNVSARLRMIEVMIKDGASENPLIKKLLIGDFVFEMSQNIIGANANTRKVGRLKNPNAKIIPIELAFENSSLFGLTSIDLTTFITRRDNKIVSTELLKVCVK